MSEPIAVTWTSTGVVSGLVRAMIAVRGPGPFHLTVSVDGDPIWEGAPEASPDGQIHVNFHTHLLSDGAHRLHLSLSDASGVRGESSAELVVLNDGELAERVRAVLASNGVPLVFIGDCDASYYAEAQRDIGCWMDSPDVERRIAEKLERGLITAGEADMLRRFARDGFVVLDAALPEPMIAAANAAIDHAVETSYQGYRYGDSTRLEQMHVEYPAMREIWLHQPVHRFLSLVFDSPSRPCQSLVYVFGSQQDAHQDTVHLTPFPAGAMCGVWIALEDVQPGSGELVVYPGSHRLPRVYMKDTGTAKVRGDWSEFGRNVVGRWAELLKGSGIEPMPYLARRGQILIWHENLMHAGSVRRDKSLSRRSIVTHNFAKGAVVYYDSSGNVGHVHDVVDGGLPDQPRGQQPEAGLLSRLGSMLRGRIQLGG